MLRRDIAYPTNDWSNLRGFVPVQSKVLNVLIINDTLLPYDTNEPYYWFIIILGYGFI